MKVRQANKVSLVYKHRVITRAIVNIKLNQNNLDDVYGSRARKCGPLTYTFYVFALHRNLQITDTPLSF